MATRRQQTEPNNRMVVTLLAVIGFGAAVALVGAGSAGTQGRGGSPAADTIVTTVAVLVGLGALGFTAFVLRRTLRPPPPVGESGASAVPFLLPPVIVQVLVTVLLLLFTVLVVGPCLNKKTAEPFPPGEQRTTTPNTAPQTDARHKPENRPNWSVVTGFVLGAAGLVLAFAAARSRRGPASKPDDPALDDEIALSLADLDGLEDDPDHRRVVIRTYARMEVALGRAGVARQPSETSQEFLHRALTSLGAGGAAAGELTALFEQARFSTHPIDATMRARAAAALRTIREDITTDATPPSLQS